MPDMRFGGDVPVEWPLTVYEQPDSGRVTLNPHPSKRHLWRPVTVAPTDQRHPYRGDEVETWLKRMRDRWDRAEGENTIYNAYWTAVDRLLDRYRECADYGLTLRPEDDQRGDP